MNAGVRTCQVLFPNTIACSGHGYCDAQIDQCVCRGSWGDSGDFRPRGLDCDIYKPAIRGLCCVSAVIGGLCALLFIYLTYHQLSIRQNKSSSAVVFLMFLACVSDTTYSISKLNNINQVAGGNVLMTITWFTSPLFTNYAAQFFVLKCLSYLENIPSGFWKDAGRTYRRIFRAASIGSYFYLAIGTIAPLSALMIMIYPSGSWELLTFYHLGQGFTVFILSASIRFYVTMMKNSLKTSQELEVSIFQQQTTLLKAPHGFRSIKKIAAKLDVVYGYFFAGTYVIPTIHCIFGLWPFFRMKDSYLFPIMHVMSKPPLLSAIVFIAPFAKIPIFSLKKILSRSRGSGLLSVSPHLPLGFIDAPPAVSGITPAVGQTSKAEEIRSPHHAHPDTIA